MNIHCNGEKSNQSHSIVMLCELKFMTATLRACTFCPFEIVEKSFFKSLTPTKFVRSSYIVVHLWFFCVLHYIRKTDSIFKLRLLRCIVHSPKSYKKNSRSKAPTIIFVSWHFNFIFIYRINVNHFSVRSRRTQDELLKC